ncbi:MAG: hypothetical protein AAGG51_21865 [Cyanobacteria bacterium P01_G01_bin.54]
MPNLTAWMNELSDWVSRSVARLFSPTDDAYPAIGTQPFSGEPTPKFADIDW